MNYSLSFFNGLFVVRCVLSTDSQNILIFFENYITILKIEIFLHLHITLEYWIWFANNNYQIFKFLIILIIKVKAQT